MFLALLVAVVVDIRTGRGYGLTILSSVLLACTIVIVVSVTVLTQVEQQPTSIHNLGPGIFLVLYFVPAIYATATTLICAAIAAGIAGHWRWIVGFFVAALVPVLLVVPPHPFLDMNTEYWVQQVGLLGMLVVPAATVLAYGITRLVHPVALAPARQLAPLN
ncbi:MAG: hypothetical protein ACRDHP_04875 [Ktedonobacterales bacterium]